MGAAGAVVGICWAGTPWAGTRPWLALWLVAVMIVSLLAFSAAVRGKRFGQQAPAEAAASGRRHQHGIRRRRR